MTKTSRELPITFSADMVNALIAGSKTMTRRIARQDKYGNLKPCRYKADDILWVRESWQVEAWDEENGIMQVNWKSFPASLTPMAKAKLFEQVDAVLTLKSTATI